MLEALRLPNCVGHHVTHARRTSVLGTGKRDDNSSSSQDCDENYRALKINDWHIINAKNVVMMRTDTMVDDRQW